MRRSLATLAVLVLSAAPLFAQPPAIGRPPTGPGYRPPVSPILNIARGGNPAINYYGIVRPQVEAGQAIGQIEQQLANPQFGGMALPPLSGTLDPVTGQPTGLAPVVGFGPTQGNVLPGPLPAGFLTHNRWYMTHQSGGGGGGGGGQMGGGQQGGINRQPNFGFAGRR